MIRVVVSDGSHLEAGEDWLDLTYLLTSVVVSSSRATGTRASVMSRHEERLTAGEMEMVMSTFKQYEVSLRGACIDVKDLLPALVSLGLNMMEQEVTDMTNTIARDGLVFFPEFCKVVLNKYREEDQEQFSQIMFKV